MELITKCADINAERNFTDAFKIILPLTFIPRASSFRMHLGRAMRKICWNYHITLQITLHHTIHARTVHRMPKSMSWNAGSFGGRYYKMLFNTQWQTPLNREKTKWTRLNASSTKYNCLQALMLHCQFHSKCASFIHSSAQAHQHKLHRLSSKWDVVYRCNK